MDAKIVKEGLNRLLQYIPAKLPPMGWFFTDNSPSGAFMPDKDTWTCMFSHISRIAKGEQLCFSPENVGCSGASCYLGFKTPSAQAGRFLTVNGKVTALPSNPDFNKPGFPNKTIFFLIFSFIFKRLKIYFVCINSPMSMA